jgi:hypothetical protein
MITFKNCYKPHVDNSAVDVKNVLRKRFGRKALSPYIRIIKNDVL